MNHGETILAKRQSAFQSICLTQNQNGLRTLRFGEDGVAQSVVNIDKPGHLELSYTRLLPACLAFASNPRRMLVVGLGGGVVPRFFHHHFPELAVDAVEIDADVVALAREFCGFVEDARLQAHVEDGRDFIEAHPGCYDVIILDSFDAEVIPPHLTTLEFARAVRAALTPAGIVIANIWGRGSNPLYESMLLTYRAAFDDLYVLDVPAAGSKLFIGLSQREGMTREQLVEKARQIAEKRGLTYDLGSLIAGFRSGELETVRKGVVLRDA